MRQYNRGFGVFKIVLLVLPLAWTLVPIFNSAVPGISQTLRMEFWGRRSHEALGRYSQQSKVRLTSLELSQELLNRVSQEPATVCAIVNPTWAA